MVAFQFTPPVWGATNYLEKNDRAEEISIHAHRMGSDCIPHNLNRDVNYFNSRSPHGERSGFCIFSVTALFFQFTLPAWRAMVVGFPYDFILLLLFISANQEKAYFLPCFFGFSSLCCLWFAPVLLILFSRL